ncbi:MAG TPA: hypothetical protein VFF57_05350 [Hanamia sp.]|nr:hypothetical protein [Hanamia sp.]
MTEQEILEGNKCIAEFDGWKLRPRPYVNSDREEFPWWEKLVDGKVVNTYHHDILLAKGRFEYGSYYSSWDWLMPVVEKIESFHLYFYIETHGSWIEYMGVEDPELPWLNAFWNQEINNDTNEGRTKLECTWLTCVQFIKWYNENKNPQSKDRG